MRKIQKGAGDKNVTTWVKTLDWSDVYLNSIVIGEIYRGILLKEFKHDFNQAQSLKRWFDEWVLVEFKNRILHIDVKATMIWANLQVPNPKAINDSYIAATAIAYDLTIATRNTRDFEGMPVKLVNPFEWVSPQTWWDVKSPIPLRTWTKTCYNLP